jgi:serpin B
MAAALGVGDFNSDEINAHYQTLMKALLEADPTTAMAIANSIWARQNYSVKQPFLDLNKQFYNAEVKTRDFSLQATVDEINKWCADNTAGRIPSIIDGQIDPATMLYLINAVYFKSRWKYEFDKAATRDEDFTLADGTTKKVKMMSQTTDLPYYSNDKFRCVDLPYGNGAFSMMVMMPLSDDTTLDQMIAELDAGAYNRAIEGLNTLGIELKLPRWKQECDFRLNDAVKNLGMPSIFSPAGQPLTGINDDPQYPLFVSLIRQKTFVEVAEEGTEAAAVTSVAVDLVTFIPGSGGPDQFHADRPFLYLIRERSTGAILFMGRFDEPKN